MIFLCPVTHVCGVCSNSVDPQVLGCSVKTIASYYHYVCETIIVNQHLKELLNSGLFAEKPMTFGSISHPPIHRTTTFKHMIFKMFLKTGFPKSSSNIFSVHRSHCCSALPTPADLKFLQIVILSPFMLCSTTHLH